MPTPQDIPERAAPRSTASVWCDALSQNLPRFTPNEPIGLCVKAEGGAFSIAALKLHSVVVPGHRSPKRLSPLLIGAALQGLKHPVPTDPRVFEPVPSSHRSVAPVLRGNR